MITKRFAILSLAALSLTACGFKPVHAPATFSGSPSIKNVRVDVVETGILLDDEAGYYLRQRLVDRLGNDGTLYTLEIEPEVVRLNLGVTADDVASRYDLTMQASYKLRDSKTGDVLDTGKVRAASAFGAPRDTYGRDAAENNATRQVASEIADRLLVKLAAYDANQAP